MATTHAAMAKDKTGERFGRLVVLGRAVTLRYWLCRCDCGAEKAIAGSSLARGLTESCGCLRSELQSARAIERFTTHGLHDHRLYGIYQGILQRCNNPKCQSYRRYGARGIRCLFRDFSHFYRWSMANGHAPHLSIDREKNEGHYSPGNCRWADMKTQGRNRSDNRLLTIHGTSRCVSEWAEAACISPRSVITRLRKGWTPEQAVLTPINKEMSRAGVAMPRRGA